MTTSTYDLDRNLHRPVIGRQAVFTTAAGERIVGTIERNPNCSYPIVRFADGRWGRLDSLVEVVNV